LPLLASLTLRRENGTKDKEAECLERLELGVPAFSLLGVHRIDEEKVDHRQEDGFLEL
jgi:hypothetical protein